MAFMVDFYFNLKRLTMYARCDFLSFFQLNLCSLATLFLQACLTSQCGAVSYEGETLGDQKIERKSRLYTRYFTFPTNTFNILE
jgi:hypothetical protein